MSETIDFAGKVVVVTGAGHGLGRAHARLLAERGAGVVVNDLGTTLRGEVDADDPAAQVAAEITAAGGTAVAVRSNVATEAGAAAIIEAALSAFGRLDAVVNNAGLSPTLAHFTEEPLPAFDLQLAVHTRGTYLVTRAAWPHLAATGAGRIVNVASNRALFAWQNGVAYSAAKGGIVGMTRAWAVDGTEVGIGVNAIMPLAVTRMTSAAGHTPLGKRLTELPSDPAQVSKLVTWLAHPSCALNGEFCTVGLGRYARVFVGVTGGIFDPDATPESIRDRWDEISDEAEYTTPRNNMEEMKTFFDNFGGMPSA